MSRKDPRKTVTLELSGALLAAVYAARRPGRSLSDVVRRWLQSAAQRPFVDHGATQQPGRRLNVQLPRPLLDRLTQASRDYAQSQAYCALQDLHAFHEQMPMPQASHADPDLDPDQRRDSDA